MASAECGTANGVGSAAMGFAASAVDTSSDRPIEYSKAQVEETSAEVTHKHAQATPEVDMADLRSKVHNSNDARAVYYAFIGHDAIAAGDWIARIQPLELSQKLDLLRAAIPALKMLESDQYQNFRAAYVNAIRLDGKRSLAEWLGYELFRNPCDRHFGLAKTLKLKYKTPESIQGFYGIVLCKFIQMGTQTNTHQLDALAAATKASGIDLSGIKLAEPVSSKDFTRACTALKQAYPLLVPRLLKGLLAAAKVDGDYSDTEQKLISILAAMWDLPLPALAMSDAV